MRSILKLVKAICFPNIKLMAHTKISAHENLWGLWHLGVESWSSNYD
jgi:hypothetical protein